MHPRLRLLHAVGGHAAVPHCGAALLLSNVNLGASKEGCRRLMLLTQQRAPPLCIRPVQRLASGVVMPAAV